MPAQPQREPALFPEGVVASYYRIVGVLGVGGTATVFDAVDERDGSRVALKAIPRDERLMRRYRREVRVAQTLDHPAIVRLLDATEDTDYLYVAFELIPGDDLARAISAGRLDDTAALRAVAGICDALSHAHERGVVHRDVKPGNVLVRDDGILKLTDFGIALIDAPDATVDDRLLGTLSYMAPEQARGQAVTSAADVFSAALIVYEALVGTNPYRARSPRELTSLHASIEASLATSRPDLPAVVIRHVDRALAHEPKRRPDAAALRDALLHGASALERSRRGERVTDQEYDDPGSRLQWMREAPARIAAATAHRGRQAAARIRGRAGLRLVSPALPPDMAKENWRALWARADMLVSTRQASLARTGSAVLAAVAGAALLNALSFYPTGWAYALALAIGALTLAAPTSAGVLTLVLVLPVFANLAPALTVIVATVGTAWLLALRKTPRAVFLPLLAPIALVSGLGAGYLIVCATASRRGLRFALGAAAPLATTLACGLVGLASPLGGGIPGVGLAARLAGRESVLATVTALHAATPAGLLVQSVACGLGAVAAPPLLNLHGKKLRIYSALWLVGLTAAIVLAPLTAAARPAPLLPAAIDVALVGTLLWAVSALRRPGRA